MLQDTHCSAVIQPDLKDFNFLLNVNESNLPEYSMSSWTEAMNADASF